MSNHIRKFILLTLSHAEVGDRAHYTPHFVVSKCRSLFNCESIIVAKELHKSKGYHYHVGILNDTASRHTAAKILRKSFAEFDGSQLNVSFHKAWNTICEYVFKQDTDPFCWGTTKDQCSERLDRKKRGKKGLDFISRLRKCSSWSEVLQDKVLADRATKSYTSVKQVFLDMQVDREFPPLEERLREYLFLKEKDKELIPYSLEELKSKSDALIWLSNNLSKVRPIREPQLFILGKPKAGKSTFLEGLKDYLFVYEVGSRKDDFSGATTNVDLWLIDEFEVDSISPQVLNRVLDGQKTRLDAKYGSVIVKDKNIPIILASHIRPCYKSEYRQSAFDSRVEYCTFLENEHVDKERFAKTLLSYLESRSVLKLPSNSVSLEEHSSPLGEAPD